jgi:phosphoribosylformimino-5-aminoimidazole carboxamide ribotide isomerase
MESPLTRGNSLEEVSAALIAAANARELYVADLDAIENHRGVSETVLDVICASTVPVWLDGGFGPANTFLNLLRYPGLRPVVGFETCSSPAYWQRCLEDSPERMVFSLDLRDGSLLGDWRAWGLRDERDVLGLAHRVLESGCRDLIVLDLARVGTGAGTGTEAIIQQIRSEFPDVDLVAGGGVKTRAHVDALGRAGATGVLVASALHEGTLFTG